MQLVVMRPTGASTFSIVAVDSETLPNALPASGVATFNLATPIPVNGGDRIGINTSSTSSNVVVFWGGGTTPTTDTEATLLASPPSPPAPGQNVSALSPVGGLRANLSAVVAPTTADAGVTTFTDLSSASAGGRAMLASTVANHSTNSAPISFSDPVPAGLAIKAAVAGDGSCSVSGQTVSCTIPDVPAGGSVPVIVVVAPQATGSYGSSGIFLGT